MFTYIRVICLLFLEEFLYLQYSVTKNPCCVLTKKLSAFNSLNKCRLVGDTSHSHELAQIFCSNWYVLVTLQKILHLMYIHILGMFEQDLREIPKYFRKFPHISPS